MELESKVESSSNLSNETIKLDEIKVTPEAMNNLLISLENVKHLDTQRKGNQKQNNSNQSRSRPNNRRKT